MKRNQKTLQSKVSAIFQNKIEQPILAFPEDFSEEAQKFMDDIAETENEIKDYTEYVYKTREHFYRNTVMGMFNEDNEPNKHEITNKEMAEVIQETVARIQELNGDLEDFHLQNRFRRTLIPHTTEHESWQISEGRRIFEDYVKNTTHWREADAIYNAYAYQIAKKARFNRDFLKNMLDIFYDQQDIIGGELEQLCNVIKLIFKNHLEEYDFEDMPFQIHEMSKGILTQLKNVKKSLEVQLYTNFEGMCLFGKALGFEKTEGEDEDEDEWDDDWEEE